MKVIKNGASYMITLPQDIVNKLKWNETTKIFTYLDPISRKIIIEEEE